MSGLPIFTREADERIAELERSMGEAITERDEIIAELEAEKEITRQKTERSIQTVIFIITQLRQKIIALENAKDMLARQTIHVSDRAKELFIENDKIKNDLAASNKRASIQGAIKATAFITIISWFLFEVFRVWR